MLTRRGVSRETILCIGDERARSIPRVNLTSGATADLLRAHGPTLMLDSMEVIAALLRLSRPSGASCARRRAALTHAWA